MSLKIKKKKAVAPIAAGTYIAICVGAVDLGTQYKKNFNKYALKSMLIWEIPSETVEVDGEQKPRWLSKEYTSSLNDKSVLSKDLVSWRGKEFTQEEKELEDGFDISSMLGQSCMLSVTVKETDSGTYNRINSVMGLPTGMPQPTTESELIRFDLDEWNDKTFGNLPGWIQEKIKKSTEYQKDHAPTDAVDVPKEKQDDPQPETEKAEEVVPF